VSKEEEAAEHSLPQDQWKHDPSAASCIKILGLLGLGLKFEVIVRIGFLANFHIILELNSHNLNEDIFDSRFAKF
jgi:hypothetical protein